MARCEDGLGGDVYRCIPGTKIMVNDLLLLEAFGRASKNKQEFFKKWATILFCMSNHSGSNHIEQTLLQLSKDHPELKASSKSFYRNRNKVNEHGLIVLLKPNQVPQSTVDEKYFKIFMRTYLPSVQAAYDRVLEIAMKDGAVTDAKAFPSVSAFERKLRSVYPPERMKALRYKVRKKNVEQSLLADPCGWEGD